MEALSKVDESVIFTGSELNHRTFLEDESWNSLQSTILAGQYSNVDDKDNLTTVDEENEEASEILDEDEGVLNMNIDAISDSEDMFFDCIPSPRAFSKICRSPLRIKASEPKIQTVPSTQYLSVEVPTTLIYEFSADSGLENEKTGAILAQMMEEMQDIKDHAQSTPKGSSDTKPTSFFLSENVSSDSAIGDQSKKKLIFSEEDSSSQDAKGAEASQRKIDFSKEDRSNSKTKCPFDSLKNNLASESKDTTSSPADKANKENYYKSKYSNAVQRFNNRPRPSFKSPKIIKPPPRRVAQIKEFFENRSRSTADQSSKVPPPKPKNFNSREKIRYRTQDTTKLIKAKSPKSIYSQSPFKTKPNSLKNLENTSKRSKTKSPKNTKQKSLKNIHLQETFKLSIRSGRHLRVSSCSESSGRSSGSDASKSERSKSLSDLSQDVKISELLYAVKMNKIVTRQRMNVRASKKSPKTANKSDIMKRKSLGFVSSPVKPVKELRKIFSPSTTIANETKKRSMKKTAPLPLIIISGIND